MLRHVVWYKFTDVSEVLAASSMRAIPEDIHIQISEQFVVCRRRVAHKEVGVSSLTSQPGAVKAPGTEFYYADGVS
jgi:hypothetical protein